MTTMKNTINKIKVKLTDGLESIAMRLGARQDKMSYVRKNNLTNNRAELDALWYENWIAKKVVAKRSSDMVRKWRSISSAQIDADKIEDFEKLEKKLKVREVVRLALQWAGLYGSAGIVLVSNSDCELPWDEKTDSIIRLIALDRHSLSNDSIPEQDILSDNFGEPEYFLVNGMQKVHRSKLILVNAGERPPSDQEKLWGVSDLEAPYATIKQFDALNTNIGDLVTESKVDVFSMEGFADKVAAGLDDDLVKLMSTIQDIKSTTNCVLLDKAITYDQKELTFTGLKDILGENKNYVAGACDMPLTIIFGQSAAGFATGEEDTKNYRDTINGLQESRLRPILERLDPILCRMVLGQMPSDWWFEFEPLGEMTNEQKANVLKVKTEAMISLLNNGVLVEHQVLEETKKDGYLSCVSEEDIEDAKLLINQEDDPNEFTPITSGEGQANQTEPQASANNTQ